LIGGIVTLSAFGSLIDDGRAWRQEAAARHSLLASLSRQRHRADARRVE
jgi:hypothetical protein